MIGLKHSDNIGAINKTNIWARMTYKDMLHLLKIEPRGTFTPTFHNKALKLHRSNKTCLDFMKRKPESDAYAFYFDFPKDSPLLVILKLKGLLNVEQP